MMTIMLLLLVFSLLPCVHGDNSTMECAQCNLGQPCQNVTYCTDAGMICVHLEAVDTFEGSVNKAYKGCIAPSSCTPLIFTMSTSGRQVQSNLVCCGTNGCNAHQNLSVPSVSSLKNGVYCPACENQNKHQCEGRVDVPCTGAEDMCIALEGVSIVTLGLLASKCGEISWNCNGSPDCRGKSDQNFSMRGCAMPSACALKKNNIMSFGGEIYRLTRNVTCQNWGSLGAFPSLATIIFQVTIGLLLANFFFRPSCAEGGFSSL